jgi:hypothetical protein
MTEVTPLRERFAALEHEQWAHWTRNLLDHLTPENVERWRRQIDTPYEGLSEPETQSDREWADRVLKLVEAAAASEGRDGGGNTLRDEEVRSVIGDGVGENRPDNTSGRCPSLCPPPRAVARSPRRGVSVIRDWAPSREDRT